VFISTPDYETLFQTQLVTDFISIRVVVSEIMSVLLFNTWYVSVTWLMDSGFMLLCISVAQNQIIVMF